MIKLYPRDVVTIVAVSASSAIVNLVSITASVSAIGTIANRNTVATVAGYRIKE